MDNKRETIFNRVAVELVSSPNEFKEWLESTPCQDYKNQLEAWLQDVRDTLEDPDNILLDKTLHRLGGNAEALRYVMVLLDMTLVNLEGGIKEI